MGIPFIVDHSQVSDEQRGLTAAAVTGQRQLMESITDS
jgi:hypothetical protein